MMTNMASTPIRIPSKYHVIFKPFDVSFAVLILIALSMVTGQHLPNYNEHEHHHNNHVCKHQHPKANDVRPTFYSYLLRNTNIAHVSAIVSFVDFDCIVSVINASLH